MNKEMVYGTVRHFLTIVSGAVLAGNTQSLATAIPDLFNKIAQGDFATIASSVVIVGSLLWSMWVKASVETKSNIIVSMKTVGRTKNVGILSGKPAVVILGNVNSCSYCKKLWTLIGNYTPTVNADKLQVLLPGADIINADAGSNPTLYATWAKKTGAFSYYPTIAVFDAAGTLKGKFTARSTVIKPWTLDELSKRIIALCPDCCSGGCTPTPPVITPPTSVCDVCSKCGLEIKYCTKCGQDLCK